MTVEVKRFEHLGYEGRIEIQVRVPGAVDGRCTIFKDDVAVDSCSVDPMVFNQAEAVGMLHSAGKQLIEEQVSDSAG